MPLCDHLAVPEHVLLVPGYTPMTAAEPIRLHPRAEARVRRAVKVGRSLGIDWVIASGGAVHPPGTPYVEADEIAAQLVRLGWRKDRILLERNARHTYTNLRNAGRLMLARGWRTARVVTGNAHALYMGFASLSRLEQVSVAEIGYFPGSLRLVGPGQLVFEPSGACRRLGRDPLDR